MVSLNNTVKIHNVIQNKQFTLLQMPAKGAKGLVIAAVTLTGRSNPCLILTKHLIQIGLSTYFFFYLFIFSIILHCPWSGPDSHFTAG